QKMMEAENKRKYADAIQKYIAAGGKLDSPEVLSNLAGYDPGAAMDVLSRREERAERREEREDDRSFRMRMFNLEMAGRKDLADAERAARAAEREAERADKAPSVRTFYDE